MLKPSANRILIRPTIKNMTDGGIHIPDIAKDRHLTGEVVAVGPGLRNIYGSHQGVDFKVGEIVMFGAWHLPNQEVIVDNEKLVLLAESEVMGTFG